MILKIKYRFEQFPGIFYTDKKELWQEPFNSGNNYYPYRKKLEKLHQGQIKYQIKNRWVSKKKLNESAYPVSETIKI
jgi:hypothetical protein